MNLIPTAILALLLGCAGLPRGSFQEHRIARIPDGIVKARGFRFSADGSTVAYIGQDESVRDRVIVGEREGKAYQLI